MENWENTTKENASQPSEFTLSGNDFLILSNICIYNAINIYRQEFKSNRIPATFVKFFFYELSGYEYLFDEKLRRFFNKIESKSTKMSVVMQMFATSFPQYAVKTGEDNFVFFIEMAKSPMPASILYSNNVDKFLKESINALNLAIKHYKKSDELRSISYVFKDYLYNTYTSDAQFDASSEPDAEADSSPSAPNVSRIDNNALKPSLKNTTAKQRQELSAMLTGRKIDMPKQRGKVVSVLFPVLPLPCAYPVMLEHSRINTDRRIKHFLSPSQEISLINTYLFNQVRFSLDFINKRKVIAEDLKKASRFDFKF